MNGLELVASVLGIISVWLLIRRDVRAFPIGIAMVLLYIIIFYQARFYSDMLLQVAYVFLQAHGWYVWTHSRHSTDEDGIAPRRLSGRQWVWSLAAIATGSLSLGSIMHTLTDAALPWVDALTTSISLTAQVQMNRRYLENWLLWIVANMIYLYQYSAKALYLTTGLYAVFLIMAVIGYREWKARYDQRFIM
jgi:nicotinamide mononucleotide transporter